MTMTYNCRDCGEQVHVSAGGHDTCWHCVEKMRADAERLRAKLARVADWLRFAANSEGGIAAEIDEVLE